ncbi:virulence factor [Robertmurraya yapensis]|uniref:Virulence factor n=1 Tax=Bacillus yapensis TaxID=2492960 RepID=A0A3S0KIA6_9BACI|nr:conserved virulence factor C family protein [Bacillus yapensis]RTR31120.1 virulence factor [Bacillus yapensis]TKS95549.1 virulence factor [Bacillus yapensis]
MKIKSIEPTPSPNSMKINLDEELPMGKSSNYKKETMEDAPKVVQDILNIDGIKGVYHVADFLAVERNAKYDWKDLLPQVRKAFGEDGEAGALQNSVDEHYGEIKVQVQMFKGIPLQVKLTDGTEERRYGMSEMYTSLVSELQDEQNYILQRKWKDFGVRYGEFDEIGKEVVEELTAAYPQERLKELIAQAKSTDPVVQAQPRKKIKVSLEDFDEPDWQKRYQLLEQMEDPTLSDLPLLDKALTDEKASIRRLATVYLGMIEDKGVLPYLYKALQDKSVTVRRTAGDCLSDLGFEEATEEMMKALQDKSKLVRWRAAMFLYEVADEKALPALKAAEDDPEFEVSLQIKLAIERIELGEEAKGSVWKQMTEMRNKES